MLCFAVAGVWEWKWNLPCLLSGGRKKERKRERIIKLVGQLIESDSDSDGWDIQRWISSREGDR